MSNSFHSSFLTTSGNELFNKKIKSKKSIQKQHALQEDDGRFELNSHSLSDYFIISYLSKYLIIVIIFDF